jgi:hypothetical protein
MIELLLDEEDSLSEITEGGPGCIAGEPKHFPLETLLNHMNGYSISGTDIAKVTLKRMRDEREYKETFETPAIMLSKRGTDDNAICIKRENKTGIITYTVYVYRQETDS